MVTSPTRLAGATALPQHRQMKIAATAAIAAIAILCVVIVAVRQEFSPLRQAEVALATRDFRDAEHRAIELLKQQPHSSRALLIAAQAAIMLNKSEQASGYLKLIPRDGSLVSTLALIEHGERCLRAGRADECEELLRSALHNHPQNPRANRLMGQLLANQGRTWEASGFARTALTTGDHKLRELVITAGVDRLFMTDPRFLELSRAEAPDDPRPRFGSVKKAVNENEPEKSRPQLEEITKLYPDLIEAQVVLGQVLIETGSDSEFGDWHARLPPGADQHPELWAVRGRWARNHNQLDAAARCYWEALRLRPDHSEACFQLAQLLSRRGDTVHAELFAEHARKISTLDLKLNDACAVAMPDVVIPVIESLESLGRYGEAAAWCRLILDTSPDDAWANQTALRLSKSIATNGWARPLDAIRAIDLSRFPMPDLKTPESKDATTSDVTANEIAFSDVAQSSGIDFHYYNGAGSQPDRVNMFEFSGGGIGVVDYDGDCWPDLYLTQGCHWPPMSTNRLHQDRLFRNLGNGQFVDVTESTSIEEFSFSQGVTIGDVDNDGFADIYVANIGPNRLFHNQGDGTYVEVPNAGGAAGDRWTTSCVIADFNGDSFPDIYALKYVGGDVLERRCEAKDRPVQCAPTMFPAEQDRLYLNLGDGSFRDITETCGIVAPDGKGLGIVVADLDGSGRLSIFVANDTTANFLFVNETPSPADLPRFSERGVLSGVACDEQGQAQACMGVAADDANGDGLVDFYVTNFYRESNVLYVQQPGQVFIDGTRQAGLREPSFLELGFGTQFIDGDLDGWPDLFVTNGHINDFSAQGLPYQMRPQFLRNQGKGRFLDLPEAGLGRYFSGRYLGRAAARLDFNRDGRADLAVGHVDASFALLQNESRHHGNYIAVRLSATLTARDAIGTKVELKTSAGEIWTKQLTAGDGFEVSNERKLFFGLGKNNDVAEISVKWPSGREEVFRKIPANQELIIVEGQRSFLLNF